MLHCTEYYARCDWSLRFIYKIIDPSLDEKIDLHKFALGKCAAKFWKLRSKSGAKMVNATFAWALFSNPVCFGIQRWYVPSLPHDLLLSFYFLCDIFAMTKFVPILLWSSVLVCKHLTSRPCFVVKAIQFLKNFYEEEFEFQAEGNTFALLNQQERLVVNGIRFTSWSNRPVSNNLLLIHT